MDLAALVNGELRVYPFTADAELQGWMLDDAEAWWKRHSPTASSRPRRIGRARGLPEAEVEADGRDAHSHRPRGVAALEELRLRRRSSSASTSTSAMQATGGGGHRSDAGLSRRWVS